LSCFRAGIQVDLMLSAFRHRAARYPKWDRSNTVSPRSGSQSADGANLGNCSARSRAMPSWRVRPLSAFARRGPPRGVGSSGRAATKPYATGTRITTGGGSRRRDLACPTNPFGPSVSLTRPGRLASKLDRWKRPRDHGSSEIPGLHCAAALSAALTHGLKHPWPGAPPQGRVGLSCLHQSRE
jgi:hypothetical protein